MFTLPTRAEIASRLATSPPIEELLTSDDLERQHEISKQPSCSIILPSFGVVVRSVLFGMCSAPLR